MMVIQSRQTRVLFVLVVSMIAGAVILGALGYHPPSAGAFCLSDYRRLMPIKTIVLCRTTQSPERWNRIEIYRTSEIDRLESLKRVVQNIDTNCHFVLCNGRIGCDGQIFSTEKWKQQVSVKRPSFHNTRQNLQDEQTIFICAITNGPKDQPTHYQVKRNEVLILELCRRFRIQSQSVHYPDDWW